MVAAVDGSSTVTADICQLNWWRLVGKLRTLKRRSSCGSGRARPVQSPCIGRASRRSRSGRSRHGSQQASQRTGASASHVDDHVSQKGVGGSGDHSDSIGGRCGSDSHAAPSRLHECKFPQASSDDHSSQPALPPQDAVLVGAGVGHVAPEGTSLAVGHRSASTRMVWIHCTLDAVSLQCGPAACLSGTEVAMFSTQMMGDCRASTPNVNAFTMLWLMEQRQMPDACPLHRASAWIIAGQMEVPLQQRCSPFGELDGLSSAYSDRSCTPWLSSREATVRSITRLPLALWLHRRASEPQRKQRIVRQAASI